MQKLLVTSVFAMLQFDVLLFLYAQHLSTQLYISSFNLKLISFNNAVELFEIQDMQLLKYAV